MDVRSIEQVAPQVVHQGTVENWWLFEPREMKPESLGGYLELIAVFEIKGGGARPSPSASYSRVLLHFEWTSHRNYW